jgi:hypothetical protein
MFSRFDQKISSDRILACKKNSTYLHQCVLNDVRIVGYPTETIVREGMVLNLNSSLIAEAVKHYNIKMKREEN